MTFTRSNSFTKIETIPPTSFAFFLKSAFSALPPPDDTSPYSITCDEVYMLYNCVILSKAVYLKPEERKLPKELGHIIIESRISDMYKIPYFVTDSDILDTIFITCRGTYCIKDFFVDFKGEAEDFHDGLMHKGVFYTSKNLFSSIFQYIKTVFDCNPNKKFIITGHSLGGGVAAAVNELFHDSIPGIKMECICFAPVASFSESIVGSTKSRCKSYTMQGDFIPFCTFRNVIDLPHGSLPATINVYLKSMIKKRIRKQRYTPKLVPFDFDPFSAPPPPISEILNDPIDMFIKPIQLYPPGECFIMEILGKDKNALEIRKVKNDKYFTHFTNDLYELRHMMNYYRDMVIKYCEKYFVEADKESE